MTADHSPVVVIAEPNMTGHRPYYVRLLIEEANARGLHPVVVTREAQLETEEARTHLARVSSLFETVAVASCTPHILASLSEELEAIHTVVPDGDRFIIRLALSRGWGGTGTLSALIMRERAQPHRFPGVASLKTRARNALFMRARHLSRVDIVVLKSAWWSGSSKYTVAHDPITLSTSAGAVERLTNAWGIDAETYWFAVLGAISRRKNVDLVARALSLGNLANVGLLVAGKWDDSVTEEIGSALNELQEQGARVVALNRPLRDDELDAAVERVDCLVLAHSNEGPSGLLGKAAAAGTRVVAAGAQSLRDDLVQLNGLGRWSPLTVADVGSALAWARSQPRPGTRGKQSAQSLSASLLEGAPRRVSAG